MCTLYSISDIFSVALSYMTYHFTIRVDHWASILGIWALLASPIVNLVCTINSAMKDKQLMSFNLTTTHLRLHRHICFIFVKVLQKKNHSIKNASYINTNICIEVKQILPTIKAKEHLNCSSMDLVTCFFIMPVLKRHYKIPKQCLLRFHVSRAEYYHSHK